MSELMLWGAPGPWPFRGAFRGRSQGLMWVGRVGEEAPLDVAFRMARSVDVALMAVESGDRRRRVAAAWDALDTVDWLQWRSDLSVLLIGHDDAGYSVSAAGVQAIWAADGDSPPAPWIPIGHPLLCGRGLPTTRPGALSVPELPPMVVAVAADDPMPSLPTPTSSLRAGSGVWP